MLWRVLNHRLDEVKERISELEDKAEELNPIRAAKRKKKGKNEGSLRDLWERQDQAD